MDAWTREGGTEGAQKGKDRRGGQRAALCARASSEDTAASHCEGVARWGLGPRAKFWEKQTGDLDLVGLAILGLIEGAAAWLWP
jgi:hypothetical protein